MEQGLKEALNELKEGHLIPIKNQLVALNSKVAKNTGFIEKLKGALVLAGVLGVTGFLAWLILLGGSVA